MIYQNQIIYHRTNYDENAHCKTRTLDLQKPLEFYKN